MREIGLAGALILPLVVLFWACEQNTAPVEPAEVSFGNAAGGGAQKAMLWNSFEGDCEEGPVHLNDGPYGYVVMNTDARGNIIVQTFVKGGTPNTTYDIWVNQHPGTCPLTSPTAPGALITNGQGNGNAHVVIAKVDGATNFWISAEKVGGQVLRSTAVLLD